MIEYYNRRLRKIEEEKVYGGFFVDLLYKNPKTSRWLAFLTWKWFSQVYGWFQDLPLSRWKIPAFLRRFSIDVEDYETVLESPPHYQTFNQFFIRRFKHGARPFKQEPHILPAFSEARYLGFESTSDIRSFPVKGQDLSAERILRHPDLISMFTGGPLLIARLCPVDYHRFHFPDSGVVSFEFRQSGALHSVNPQALKQRSSLFWENERHITLFQSDNLGHLGIVEVGAICVGKIVQTYNNVKVMRGQEKGYFLFGGSSVLLFGEPGKWKPSDDILQHTKEKREVWVPLGQELGRLN